MSTFRHSVCIPFCTLMLVALLACTAQSQQPPQNLRASWDPSLPATQTQVIISWSNSYGPNSLVWVYFAEGRVIADDTTIDWKQAAYAMNDNSAIADLSQLGFTSARTLSFKAMVTVQNGTDSSSSTWSNIAIATWPPGSDTVHITFTTTPPTTAWVGEEYVYDAHATSNDRAFPVWYDFTNAPGDMTVEGSTGHISFTPTDVGIDSVTLRAYDSLGRESYQSWTILVDTRDTSPGTLISTILDDSTHKAISGATVTAVCVGAAGDTASQHGAGYGSVNIQTTNSNGRSYSSVRPGKYSVHVDAPGYATLWADSARTVGAARRLTVMALTQTLFTVSLHRLPTGMCTIRGNVQNGTGPVPNANVTVTALNAEGMMDEKLFYGRANVSATGTYQIAVPRGDTVIIAAYAPGYSAQYWSTAASPLEALRIYTDQATFSADFTLSASTTNGAPLSGRVTSCDPSVKNGIVTVAAYRLLDSAYQLWNSCASDTEGNYSFADLDTGMYIVQALPVDDARAPGYYSLTHPCSYLWTDATAVAIGAVGLSGIDITLGSANRGNGFAEVAGRVKLISGSPATTYLNGACVVATNAGGGVDGYAYTDANGEFIIAHLPAGNHTVTVTKVNYSAIATTDVASNYEALSKQSVVLSAHRVSASGVEDVPQRFDVPFLAQNFPNPASPSTDIVFTLNTPARVELAVFDVTGRRVQTVLNGMCSSGDHVAHVDASTLPNGLYVYRLLAPTGQVSRKMVVLK